jgi:tyrosine-protein kinase
MSKHFDLFKQSDHSSHLLQSGVRSRGTSVSSRPALGLNLAWRARLEKLVTTLYLLPASPKPQVLVFIEPEPGKNSNIVSAHTSDLLACRVNVPVCLWEANPKVTWLREGLQFKDEKGIADLLNDPDLKVRNVAKRVPGGDLWLLPSGSTSSPPKSLVDCERLLDRFSELRACFDFVLIDAPPLSESADALTLAQLADAAVLVLPTSGASRESTFRMKQDLEANGVRLLGAVLVDNAPSPSPQLQKR